MDSALTLFSKQGYFGTSLRDIATSVGIRESALYNYFPSKEALFEELIVTGQESMGERLFEALDDPITDVRVALTRFAMRALEDFATPRQEQIFRILMSDGIRLARDGRINLFERMSCSRARIDDLMGTLIEAGGLRPADPQLLAMEFMAPLLVWRHMNAVGTQVPATSDPRIFASQHVNQFLLGASARAGRRISDGRQGSGSRLRQPLVHSSRDDGAEAVPASRSRYGASTGRHTRKRTERP
jgi:AcrR family transcriptional regulator